MDVRAAVLGDEGGFMALAAGVEPWFGPMVADPGFREALHRNIGRGSAFVVRGAGDHLLGGILTGGRSPAYRINWLVVDEAARRGGVGKALVDHVTSRCPRPGTVEVVTFGDDHPAADPSGARAFYERLGFTAAGTAPDGPEGGSRQRLRLPLD
ncbi:GNAT family N-acetyltransferase [Actinoplanes sp. NPDC051851]|uniref:GNAT family N-acetyltransferase n=1 Tax=Actinoplanes sp. NPDC051851 TaxID=3154753 RepID=UPI003448EE41